MKNAKNSQPSVKKNYIYNVSYQILVLLTPFITTPYVSRVLGADGVGTSSYVQSISSYFVLFATMGMTTFGQRETAYVRDSREERTRVFWETNILEAITAVASIVVYVVFAFGQDNPNLYLVLIFNLISVVANVTWFFQGMEEFGRIVLRNVIFKVINIAYIFIVVKTKDDLIWYLFGIAFFAFLSNASLWFYLPKYIGLPKWKELHPLRHVKPIIMLFIPTVAIQIYTVLDKTMIGLITGDAFENGYYEQASKISKMALTFVTSLGTVMVPRIGHEFAQKNTESVRGWMYRGYRFVWFLGIPLCFGLFMVSDNMVPWFFGSGYDKVALLLKILAFLILAIGINNVTGVQYMIPTKRENMFTVTVIIGAAVNFVLNLFLIYFFQSLGASIASVAAESTIAIVQLWLVRKELSPLVIIKEGINYYVAGALMAIVLWLVGRNLASSILHTFILIFAGAAIYFVVLLVMRDEFFVSNVKKVLQKFVKRKK